MRRRVARVMLAAALSVIGCAAPQIAVRSQVTGAAAPLQRIKVYAPLVTGDVWNPMSQPMYDAFKASLALRLQLCRVSAEISSEPPPASGPAAAGSAPVASLGIELADKRITEMHRLRNGVDVGVSFSGTVYFQLTLADGHAPAPVWSARTSFGFGDSRVYTTHLEIAEVEAGALARAVVGQLHHDGFLPGCIHEAYVGCVADRREAHQRAARMADPRDRLRETRDLADCN